MSGGMIKKGLWCLLSILMFMPLIQYNLNLFTIAQLAGYYEKAADPTFTKESWWEGTYQEHKTKYINENVGFHPDLVRINSQVDFSVFNGAVGATMGREHYLFYSDYVWATLGYDFLGEDLIREQVMKMKYIQEALEGEGRTFLFVEAASKTDYMPEMVYDIKDTAITAPTNLKVYNRYCDSVGVNHIDAGRYFKSMKGKTKPKPFTKQGIHWSMYGAMYVVDSMIKFIEGDRNIDLPNPEWGTYIKTDKARNEDDDVGKILNLIVPIKETFYYPEIKFPEDTVTDKPSAVYIGDSFTWPLIHDSLMTHTHSSWEFWYYFNTVHTEKTMRGEEPATSIPDYDWKKKLDAADCIILVFVSQNFPEMNRFIDSAYNYYLQKGQQGRSIGKQGK